MIPRNLNLSFSNLTLSLGDQIANILTPHSLQDSTLAKNLRYAKAATSYTLNALPLGAENVIGAKVSLGELNQMRLVVELTTFIYSLFKNPTPKELLQLTAKSFTSYGYGNCGEHTLIALSYLVSKKIPQVEQIDTTDDDHTFLVIGRDPTSSINDIASWGESAVICDPWAHRYYPAKELNYHLHDSLMTRLKPELYTTNLLQTHKNLKTTPPDYNNKLSRTLNYTNHTLKKQAAPILSEKEKLKVKKQLDNYQTFLHRASIHKMLYDQTENASIATAAMGSLILAYKKLRGRFSILGAGTALAASLLIYFSKDFFKSHKEMYMIKATQVW